LSGTQPSHGSFSRSTLNGAKSLDHSAPTTITSLAGEDVNCPGSDGSVWEELANRGNNFESTGNNNDITDDAQQLRYHPKNAV
uniref:Pecanex-like protein n=1 Tax=Gongylonema pulchrum TaxID=637853 RepID=A0A183EUI8_9BILA